MEGAGAPPAFPKIHYLYAKLPKPTPTTFG
jgi:hypothetical protein